MKRVEAIIKPFKVDEVKLALSEIGVTGLTATEVKGFGRQQGLGVLHRDAEYMAGLLPKVKIEVVVTEALVGQVIDLLQRVTRTGKIGDGKIFVSSVEASVRIRTGDRGEGAL
jgi:nitrogen regulatory protein P-II 1